METWDCVLDGKLASTAAITGSTKAVYLSSNNPEAEKDKLECVI